MTCRMTNYLWFCLGDRLKQSLTKGLKHGAEHLKSTTINIITESLIKKLKILTYQRVRCLCISCPSLQTVDTIPPHYLITTRGGAGEADIRQSCTAKPFLKLAEFFFMVIKHCTIYIFFFYIYNIFEVPCAFFTCLV